MRGLHQTSQFGRWNQGHVAGTPATNNDDFLVIHDPVQERSQLVTQLGVGGFDGQDITSNPLYRIPVRGAELSPAHPRRLPGPSPFYSQRRASTGLTRVARRAGKYPASRAATVSAAMAPATTTGSRDFTPNSWLSVKFW